MYERHGYKSGLLLCLSMPERAQIASKAANCIVKSCHGGQKDISPTHQEASSAKDNGIIEVDIAANMLQD